MIKAILQSICFMLFILMLGTTGCFPEFEATTISHASIKESKKISSPTKVYLLDASVVLFPRGFSVRGDTVWGQGARFWIDKSDPRYRDRVIALDSIVAMTSYESRIPPGREIASLLLAVTGGVMTPLSIYCISCPKCCFGSCPTVYTNDRMSKTPQAELFSHSISRQLEDSDLAALPSQRAADNTVELTLTSEALETHYINKLSLISVKHPPQTRVFPSDKKKFIVVRDLQPPATAVDRNGKDILPLIIGSDSFSYRTNPTQFSMLAERGEHDRLELKVDVPQTARKVNMVLRLRNTLLSTILFYDVVLASQGVDALNWTHRMNHDENYAVQFRRVYETFSGIHVDVQRAGEWTKHCTIEDVGPIAWKYVATEIPLGESKEFIVRLDFFPDNIAIDYVGFSFDAESANSIHAEEIAPLKVLDDTGAERDDIPDDLALDDDRYLVTEPGDSYRLVYQCPHSDSSEITLFISSKGYYTEWIRGNWLRVSDRENSFNLSDIKGTLSQLVRSWLENKDEIEEKFFRSRIRTRGSL